MATYRKVTKPCKYHLTAVSRAYDTDNLPAILELEFADMDSLVDYIRKTLDASENPASWIKSVIIHPMFNLKF